MQKKDKEILENFQNKTHFTAKKMSKELRTAFYTHLQDIGMSAGTVHRRICLVGFKEWERVGLLNILKEYSEMRNVPVMTNDNFFDVVKNNRGIKEPFIAYMATRGMSRMTIYKRMEKNDWQSWELNGFASICEKIKQELDCVELHEETEEPCIDNNKEEE